MVSTDTVSGGPRAGAATRRGFVAGAAAGAFAQLAGGWPLGIAPAEARARRCEARPPGVRRHAIAVSADGRTLWTADTGTTTISAYRTRDLVRRRSIDVGAAPTALALAPGGRTALVTGGFYDRPGLALVDLHAGKVLSRLDAGHGLEAVALAPGGRSAWVAGGGAGGRLTRVDLRSGLVAGSVAVGVDPRGLALTADGDHALVALNGEAAVAVVSLRHERVVKRIATAPFPYLVAAAPAGDRAFVSHNGLGARELSWVDVGAGRSVHSLNVGADPAGLAWAGHGAVLVAERGAGTVTVLDARTGRRRRRMTTGGFPRALAVRGGRAYVADEQTGQLWSMSI